MTQDKESVPDNYIIREFISLDGKPFAVAYPPDMTDITDTNPQVPDDAGDSGWVDVNWPVGFVSWARNPLDHQVTDLGIVELAVSYYSTIWDYKINFRNDKGWGFQFRDATKDVYRISTFRNGWHYLLYNSKDPTIIAVK